MRIEVDPLLPCLPRRRRSRREKRKDGCSAPKCMEISLEDVIGVETWKSSNSGGGGDRKRNKTSRKSSSGKAESRSSRTAYEKIPREARRVREEGGSFFL